MNQLYAMNNKVLKTLEKNRRYLIFLECLKRYNLLNQLTRPGVTLFIPTNTSFLFRLEQLEKEGDAKIREILLGHIVPQRLQYLQIGKPYMTAQPNKSIVLTGEKKIDEIVIEGNPKVVDNVVIYRVNDIIL